MQLSFVFITALVAAVSATPLPQAAQKRAEVYYESVSSGGAGGVDFSDLGELQGHPTIPTITRFGGRAGDRVDQVFLDGFLDISTNTYHVSHGGSGGRMKELVLPAGEYINYMEIEWGTPATQSGGANAVTSANTLVSCVRVRTNLNNWGELGTPVPGPFTTPYSPPTGYTRVVGFKGKAGDTVDRLGPIWA